MSYGAPFFHLMKIAFLPLLRSVSRHSRTVISLSVGGRQRCQPMTRMTMKCCCGCQSSLLILEKSQFSICPQGGRKRLFLRLKSRYRLHRMQKARRIILLCFPSSSRYGSGPRASLSRGRARLVHPPHSALASVLVSRISPADLFLVFTIFQHPYFFYYFLFPPISFQ